MSIAKLKGKAIREGYMLKLPAARGEDKMRNGKWKQRWFILDGHLLQYFESKTSSTPKGEIDMRACKIDSAEKQTKLPYTLKLSEARQKFTYVQCNSVEDAELWLRDLRKVAGYSADDEEVVVDRAEKPKHREECLCSFGVIMLPEKDGQTPQRVVLYFDYKRTIKIARSEMLLRNYPALLLQGCEHSQEADIRMQHSTGISEMVSLALSFKDSKGGVKHNFAVGSVNEAKMIALICQSLIDHKNETLKTLLDKKIVMSGLCEIDDPTTSTGWVSHFVTVSDGRAMVFHNQHSVLPVWVMALNPEKARSEGERGVSVFTGIEMAILKMSDTASRNTWLAHMQKCSLPIADMFLSASAASPETAHSELKAPTIAVKARSLGGYDDLRAQSPSSSSSIDTPINFTLTMPSARGEIDQKEDSYILTWGLGDKGQLGVRTKDNSVVPQLVSSVTSKQVRWISAGLTHSALVTQAGHVYTWGQGDEGQLGLGSVKQSSSPYLMAPLLKEGSMTRVVCGRNHTICVSTLGKTWSWGAGDKGQLGHETLEAQFQPKPIKALEKSRVIYIAAGNTHSAAIIGDLHQNELYVWGSNLYGCLGLGDQAMHKQPTPHPFQSKGTSLAHVTCGDNFTLFSTRNGRLFSFGKNDVGQLGLGDEEDRLKPVELDYFIKETMQVLQVSAGNSHVIALTKREGESPVVYTWGKGVLNGFQEDQNLPVPVEALANTRFVTASTAHSMTVNENCEAFAFGLNDYGELGNGQAQIKALVRVKISRECKVAHICGGQNFTVTLCTGKPPQQLVTADTRGARNNNNDVIPPPPSRSELKENIDTVLNNPDDEASANAQISILLKAFGGTGTASAEPENQQNIAEIFTLLNNVQLNKPS